MFNEAFVTSLTNALFIGKTAGFVLPILHRLLSDQRTLDIGKPHAVIVSPTRELAIQIFNECRKFSHGSIIKVEIAYGGTTVRSQSDRIMRGVHVLVATPGRLLDFVDKGLIQFDAIRFVVLDEADRMLDMGFLEPMRKMIQHPTMTTGAEKQTLMFSATFPEEVQRIAGEFLNDYVFIAVGVVGGACADVEQTFVEASRHDKRTKLMVSVFYLFEDPFVTFSFLTGNTRSRRPPHGNGIRGDNTHGRFPCHIHEQHQIPHYQHPW